MNACIKCGFLYVKIKYVAPTNCNGRKFDEYLNVTCEKCGYVWHQPTNDAPPLAASISPEVRTFLGEDGEEHAVAEYNKRIEG